MHCFSDLSSVCKPRNLLVPILILLLVVVGCSPFKPLRIESLKHSSVYDELFPYHVEVCALSQIKPVNGGKGTRAGHGVLFLEGACRDEAADFPQLKMCPKEVSQILSESGVGISVNKMFRNVNWVAAPGQNLFYYGNLSEEKVLTEEVREGLIDHVVDLGVFRGVQVHDHYLKSKSGDESLEKFIARRSLGTDYALRFGRSVLCMKIPVTRPMMEEIISYLNRRNQEYALGGKEFRWDAFSDNCTHTIYNALASVDMVNPRLIRAGRIRWFFNLAVPANAVASIAELASPDPLDDIKKIAGNQRQRTTLLKYQWLPMHHGTLLSALLVHEKNELYEVETSHRFETLILRSRALKSRRRLLNQAFSDERFTDLESNLNWFEQQYKSIAGRCQAGLPPGKVDMDFYESYCRYIEDQLEDVRKGFAQL
jgi:hypothetical protein